jgi:hypothetical protein
VRPSQYGWNRCQATSPHAIHDNAGVSSEENPENQHLVGDFVPSINGDQSADSMRRRSLAAHSNQKWQLLPIRHEASNTHAVAETAANRFHP